ncbi:MAG: hypothetical protein KBS61_07875, partial [Chryseobacterium sp.]|nr:hypothetical protein [Candidatus Chryseobacterium enterohippi]
IITTLVSNLYFSQAGNVGIKTTSPTRTLDINGTLRVRTTLDKSEDGEYTKILISNTKGDVDYIVRADLLPKKDDFASDKQVINNLYSNTSNAGDPNKIIKCGKFKFAFGSTSETKIQFALVDKPTANVEVYMSMEQNWHLSGFQFFQGTTGGDTNAFVFTTDNYATMREFAAANLADREQNVMHFQYPNDKNLYRLTVYKVFQSFKVGNASTTSYDFVTTCEKF